MQATPPPSPTPCRKSPRSNHKRARLHGPELPPSLNPPSAACSQHFCGSEAVVVPDSALMANSSINANSEINPSNLLDSLSHLKDEAHRNRLSLQQRMIQGKGTETAYPRHVKAYMSFWSDYQDSKAKEIPGWVRIPAHPIIGDKVAVFLQHESTRNKRDRAGHEIGGTSVGKSSILQTISALQGYIRDHQHEVEYRNCPETQTPLRDQACIKTFEKAVSANEPARISNAHVAKSKGTTADTYTKEELLRLAIWCLQSFSGSKAQVHIGIRDRALLLLSTSIAFRGDSCRGVLLSDLLLRTIPMMNVGFNSQLLALVVLADQAKTNSNGRVDEHGAFRHRHPELCCLGSLALYLFSHFQVQEKSRPNFAPDFTDPKHTEYGRRDWYRLFLFPGKGKESSGTHEMTYENHRERIHLMHKKNNISISKVTHAGRGFSVINARAHRASADDARTLGRWSTGEPYAACYDRSLPTGAMLAAAMFNAEKPETYCLPRGHLEPPRDLLDAIFPWAEEEMAAYESRVRIEGPKAVDFMLKHFLDLLVHFRTVLLQDSAVLYSKYPECAIWDYPPFNTMAFRDFSSTSCALLARAEHETQLQIQKLPETVAQSMMGFWEQQNIQHALERQASSRQNQELQDHIFRIENILMASVSSSTRGRKLLNMNGGPASSQLPLSTQPSTRPPTQPPVVLSFQSPSPPTLPLDPIQLPSLNPGTHTTCIIQSPTPVSPLSAWPPAIAEFSSCFRLSTDEYERTIQLTAIQDLVKKHGRETILRHVFEWTKHSSLSISDEWLPIYRYKQGVSVQEIWEEWSEGLDGCLSVRTLNENWDARWRRNNSGQKTEAGRRKKIIELIEALARKPNWNIRLALRFLQEEYPIPSSVHPYLKSTRAFIEHLQKKSTGQAAFEAILLNAASYCSS